MSRRESRASLGARQNDALYEFEAFKKKFLLANKHITKLNSTLSVRIEELNAQIHALNVENLRLRTSEIQLTSELKREREKTRKIMTDTEAATLALTRHLNYLRTTMDIPEGTRHPQTPPSPKARRRPTDNNASGSPTSPQGMRIARPPTIPGIFEEDEPISVGRRSPFGEAPLPTPPKRKSKSQRRLSASNLPLPTNRVGSPTLGVSGERGNVVHMDLSVALTASNASGAFPKRKTIRRQSGLVTIGTTESESSLPVPRPPSPAFGSPERGIGARLAEEIVIADEEDVVLDILTDRHAEKWERRNKKITSEEEEGPPAPPKDRKRRREGDDTAVVTVDAITSKPKSRIALQPIDNTVFEQVEEPPSSKQFLAPLIDSPSPAAPTTPEPESSNGRERRARKSVVSYAEPSLKVKMRKPDGATTSEPKKKRTSTATNSKHREQSPTESQPDHPPERRSSFEKPSQLPVWSGVETTNYPEPFAPNRKSTTEDAVTGLKRRKSRPPVYNLVDEDEDSDGGEADGEYVPPSAKKWNNVNVEGRRKTGKLADGDGEVRRHSIAV